MRPDQDKHKHTLNVMRSADTTRTLTSMAAEIGVSRERVRQLFVKYGWSIPRRRQRVTCSNCGKKLASREDALQKVRISCQAHFPFVLRLRKGVQPSAEPGQNQQPFLRHALLGEGSRKKERVWEPFSLSARPWRAVRPAKKPLSNPAEEPTPWRESACRPLVWGGMQ